MLKMIKDELEDSAWTKLSLKTTGYAERAHATGVTFDGRREALPVGPRARVWWQNRRRGKDPLDADLQENKQGAV